MSRLRPVLALVAVLPLVLLGLTACKSSTKPTVAGTSGDLPAGATVLAGSATAMSDIKTAQFVLAVDGTIAGLSLKQAKGTLTREGNATGTAQITQDGSAVEVSFVIVGDKLYVKGATGGYQTLPLALASAVYDPSAILDPDRGIAKVLRTATDAKTESSESVDGKPAWRVAASVSAADLATIVPGLTGQVPSKLWVSQSDQRLLKATFTLPDTAAGKGGSATVTFTAFDQPVTISAP